MRGPLYLLPLTLLSACAASRSAPVELAGTTWAVSETAVSSVTILKRCHANDDLLFFDVEEGAIQLTRMLRTEPSGIARTPGREWATGQWEGAVLRLRGEAVPPNPPGRQDRPATALRYEL